MKLLRVVILVVLFISQSKAQPISGKYLIITLERERSWDVHEAEYSYWMVHADSINEIRGNLRPLYLKGFSVNNFDSCCLFDSLAMFHVAGSNFNFNNQYLSQVERLVSIIKQHGKRVQTIRKKWTDRSQEKINIYLTPVNGNFCECKIGSTGVKIDGISSVAIPKSDFSPNDKFWDGEAARSIKNYDFSNLSFLNFRSIL